MHKAPIYRVLEPPPPAAFGGQCSARQDSGAVACGQDGQCLALEANGAWSLASEGTVEIAEQRSSLPDCEHTCFWGARSSPPIIVNHSA